MSNVESCKQDVLYEEEAIFQENAQPKYYDTELAKRLKKDAKITNQPASIQKYWLGRLAYELAMRNANVKRIIENSEKFDASVNYYDVYHLSEKEKYLILQLHPYGFSAQPEPNVLATEHTTFPTRLIHYKYGYMEINTIKKIEKLLAVLNGKTAKQLNMNTNDHKKWFKIGKAYIQSYMELISLDYYDEINKKDYEPMVEPEDSSITWSL